MIVVLTGGTGGAKFVDGLRQIVPAKDLTIIVNTGDDLEWWGLYVSPDLDSITYVLAGLLSKERGWGVKGDTFFCLQAMGELGEPIWFHAGDRDLAVHLLRTKLLREGKTLTEVSAEIAAKMGVQSRILPMCNARVETRVDTPIGELSFEEYFVQRWYQDPVNSVRFAGVDKAEPAPGVIDAILVRHGRAPRPQQSRHQHWSNSCRAGHRRGSEANQCPGRRDQPHHRHESGLGTCRIF